MSGLDKELQVIAVAFGLYDSNRHNFLRILKPGIKDNIEGSYTDGELRFVAAFANDIIKSGKVDGLANPSKTITGPECKQRLQQINTNPDPSYKYATVPENARKLSKEWGNAGINGENVGNEVAYNEPGTVLEEGWIERITSGSLYGEPA